MKIDDLNTAIAGLGTTAEEIADTLLKEGVTGVVLDVTSCPISRYLSKKLDQQIEAGSGAIRVKDDPVVQTLTPHHLRSFMADFDDLKADTRLYQKRDNPKWTPPINGWQYRLEYSKDKNRATCPAAKKDGLSIFATPQEWVIFKNCEGLMGRSATLHKAVKLFIGSK